MAVEPYGELHESGHVAEGLNDPAACPPAIPEESEPLHEPDTAAGAPDAMDSDAPEGEHGIDEFDGDEALAERPHGRSRFWTVLAIVVVAVLFYGIGQFAYLHGGPILVPSKLASYEDGQTASYRELSLRVDEVARGLDDDALNSIDINAATDDVVTSLLERTGDEHADYFDEGAYQSYLKRMSGEYAGIGVSLSDVGSYAMVMDVYAGSPAAEAGVEPGDVFVTIDGKTGPWTSSAVVKALEREEGSPVDIVFLRPSDESMDGLSAAMQEAAGLPQEEAAAQVAQYQLEGETVELHMDYRRFTIPNVESRMMGTAGYVKLSAFTQKAAEQTAAEIASLMEQGATGIVLDLRGNGGGIVDQAVDLVSQFVAEGAVVRLEGRSGTTMRNVNGKVSCELPLVVLVDARTASASEITAGALKDHGRAKIVGATTYGKGTVQEIRRLSFGGAIKYTVAEYTTPNGTKINKVGIEPDVAVELAEGNVVGEAGNDAQLDAALAVLVEQAPAAGTAASGADAAPAESGSEG